MSVQQPLTKYDVYKQVAHAYNTRLRDTVEQPQARHLQLVYPGTLQLATPLDYITDGKGEYIMVSCILA